MDVSDDVVSRTRKVEAVSPYQISISGEDHTLLNVLKYVINKKYSEVELCGYTIPHPSEDVAIFKVQFQKEESQREENIYSVLVGGLACIEEIGQKLLSEVESWEVVLGSVP